LGAKIFFDKETFGADRLVVNPKPLGGSETAEHSQGNREAWRAFMADAPLSEQAREDYRRLHGDTKDYLAGLSSEEKKDQLARMSYAKYLSDLAGVSEEVIRLLQAAPQPLFGVGIDAVSAQDAWGLGFPGFDGLKLDPSPGKGMNRDAIPNEEAEKYFFHFPDGNASIARLLVRNLIPQAIPGSSAADVVTARANYARLDNQSSPVRIRLNSTVVRVKHEGDPQSAQGVEITYAKAGKTYTVSATASSPAGMWSFPTFVKSCPSGRSKPCLRPQKYRCSTRTWCSETGHR
jgi:spermidine dehydrogenase